MRTLNQIQPGGKVVFCRVDFNLPLADGEVQSAARLDASLPTINYLLARDARLVLASHLGRPEGQVVESLRMAPVARALQRVLDCPVHTVDAVRGPEVAAALERVARGEVLLLENLRFEPGEQAGDPAFAADLARGAELYVNEAFANCHRADASIVALAGLLPGYAGLLLEKEISSFSALLEEPQRPFWLLAGGAKVKDKIPLLRHLLDRVQGVALGGALAYTFLAAEGQPVGGSRVEAALIEPVRDWLARARARGVEVMLPIDHVVGRQAQAGTPHETVERIEPGWLGLDIGPETVRRYGQALAAAGTVFWNGPLGLFEVPPFDAGTRAVCRALAASDATSVVGGGETVQAVEQLGLADRISHISTGGGASLQLLSGDPLPGVVALEQSPAA